MSEQCRCGKKAKFKLSFNAPMCEDCFFSWADKKRGNSETPPYFFPLGTLVFLLVCAIVALMRQC